MGLCRLKIVFLCILLVSCNTNREATLTYLKFSIGKTVPIDSMNIVKTKNVYSIKDKNIYINHNIQGESLQLQADGCMSETTLNLKIGKVVDFKCGSIYPFFGERITVLDIKSFYINDEEYRVYKLFNEIGDSYLNSSTLFLIGKNTLALILIREGEYYELKDWNPDLIKLIKEDLDFSEMWPIPPPPPPPAQEIEEQN